jgi:hypothetical protein
MLESEAMSVSDSQAIDDWLGSMLVSLYFAQEAGHRRFIFDQPTWTVSDEIVVAGTYPNQFSSQS